MKINIDNYTQLYKKTGSYQDLFQKIFKLIPFGSAYKDGEFDKHCDLMGTAGAFLRKYHNYEIEPIIDRECDLHAPVRALLTDEMTDPTAVDTFLQIVDDLFYTGDKLNITDVSLIKYYPNVPNKADPKQKNHHKGQENIADFLTAMIKSTPENIHIDGAKDIFSKIIQNAKDNTILNKKRSHKSEYLIPNFIRETFYKDLTWFLSLNEQSKLRYLPLLLHFYVCYAITQSIIALNPSKCRCDLQVQPIYFIFETDKVSQTHDAVIQGWQRYVPDETLNKLFGKIQALHIHNCLLGGKIGFYQDIINRLDSTPFLQNKNAIENFLATCQDDKKEHIRGRERKTKGVKDHSTAVSSYDEYLERLEKICCTLQDDDFKRVGDMVKNILSVRFLRHRRQYKVLLLDREMLIFLIALVSKNKMISLEEMYIGFEQYGIRFNRGTKSKIEDFLLNSDILVKMSDSGENQYVQIIL